MPKKREKDKNALINHKNLERNIASEIANEFHKDDKKGTKK
jgi:hypothetical protein